MKRLTKLLLGTILGTLMIGTTVMAAEEKPYQVTPTSAIGYTNENTVVMADAMPTGAVVLTAEQCPDAIGIIITGITDTGYWEVDLGQPQKFYIAGPFLDNVTLVGAVGTGNGAVANNETTANTTTNATTNTTASATTAISGEEACIQWVTTRYGTVNTDECRWFYREYMKLYEQCKSNPKTYTEYYSELFDNDSVKNQSRATVAQYFDEITNNYAFNGRMAGDLYKLVVYKTESMSDKGVYFE